MYEQPSDAQWSAMPPRKKRKTGLVVLAIIGALGLALLCGGVLGVFADDPTTSKTLPNPSPAERVCCAGAVSHAQNVPPVLSATVAPEVTTAAAAPIDLPKAQAVKYPALTHRSWLKIARNPDAYAGKTYTVYGVVTQFDAATGDDGFRADVDGVKHGQAYDYSTNTIMSNVAAKLGDIVEGDQFVAQVIVVGGYSYDTQLGGNTTAPQLGVMKITRR